MDSYVRNLAGIERMLNFFLAKGIDTSKLRDIERIVMASKIDQFKILNSPLSLDKQRALFGATRNLTNTLQVMEYRLETARQTHENPTTIELSLELIPHLSSVGSYVDDFTLNKHVQDLRRINEASRILHRKASELGFSQDIETQLKEAEISEEEAATFIRSLNKNFELLESEHEA